MARVKQNPAENFNKPLAVRLRALIDESGHSKADLGKEIGVSRQAINAIETGKFDPSIWLAYDLSKLFDTTIEDFFDFEGSERK